MATALFMSCRTSLLPSSHVHGLCVAPLPHSQDQAQHAASTVRSAELQREQEARRELVQLWRERREARRRAALTAAAERQRSEWQRVQAEREERQRLNHAKLDLHRQARVSLLC